LSDEDLKNMRVEKRITWLLILIILLLPAPAIFKYLRTYIVRNAVVTAYRFDVRAPIDGVIETLSVGPGDIPGDVPAMLITNRRQPLAEIGALDARCLEKKKFLSALEEERAGLERRLEENRAELGRYRVMLQRDLEQTLAILQAREKGEAARLKEAEQRRSRVLTLLRDAVSTQENADQAEADFLEALSRLTATRLEQDQVRHRYQMLRENLFVQDLSDGALQTWTLIQTLESELLDCVRRINVAETDLAADFLRAEALRKDMEDRTVTADITLPQTAVIWDIEAGRGTEVAKGDRLLSYIDRSVLLVDVAVDDATLELITPDHPVRIRLFGSGRFVSGKVFRIFGSAARLPEQRLAAEVTSRSTRDGRVLVRIEDDRLYEDTKRLCGIGRTAYAEFEGIGLAEQYLGAFLR
jgi:multidrug resistance efflux pump